MKLDNRDLVLRALLGVLPAHLECYVRTLLADHSARVRVSAALGSRAPERSRPAPAGASDLDDLADLSTQIRVLTLRGDDGRYLLPLPPGLGGKLHEVRRFRNDAVHGRSFDADDALAALVAVSETLRLIGRPEARAEVRALIDVLDTDKGAGQDPLSGVQVDVDCPAVLGYADAVASGRVPVALRLRLPEPMPGRDAQVDQAGQEAAAVGALDVTVVITEDGSGRQVTIPWVARWDLASPGARELAVTAELEPDRSGLLQVEQPGPTRVRVELGWPAGARSLPPTPGPVVLPPRHWRMHDDGPAAGAALATFVQPGQGAVEELAVQARARVSTSRTGPRAEADALARAACEVLRGRRVTVEDGEPWTRARPVRTAGQVLDERRAAPVDLAVLLAGLLENMGAAPVLLLNPDTVFLGYMRTSAPAVPCTPAEARGLVERGEMGLIDPLVAARSTGAVHPRLTDRVRGLVLPALADLSLVVPVAYARSQGALPQPALTRDLDDVVVEVDLAAPDHALAEPASAQPGAVAAGPDPDHAPLSGERSDAQPPDHEPAPPVIDAWKTSLLDLSLRNPLIDCTARHAVVLRVPEESVGTLEDIVNDRQLISLRPEDRTVSEPAASRSAAAELTEHRIVRFARTGQKGEWTLERMAAEARMTVEHTGANNLYLTVGALVWSTGGRRLRSPLFLVPVVLEPDGENHGLVLDQMGSSAPNHSLLRRFRADTGIVLDGLDEPVRDGHGIDIETTMARIRAQVRESGHDAVVEPTVHLGMFQFSTFRMWQDLEESWPTIASNPLVARLMGDHGSRAGDTQALRDCPTGAPDGPGEETDLDALVENLPLAADATQAQVVADAVAGRSLVVEGPPGTGKSQTVANLIFRALATGRTVMFVAEKRSALSVVARRLGEAGIGELLLNLHDNGMKPAEVRKALRSASELRATGQSGAQGAQGLRSELSALRQRLEDYRRALHATGPDGRSRYSARQSLLGAQPGRVPPRGGARPAPDADLRADWIEAFDAADHNVLLDRYRDAQERLRQTLPAELREAVLTRRDRVLRAAGPRAEDLRRELGRRSSSLTIRDLMGRYGDLITAYTPCLLVSPDSVARFFPPERRYVDIVVFDEASQITVAGAVGAMGRGRSVVVLGDPKQMPPASVSGTAAARGALEAAGAGGEDSILDRCLEIGVARRRLNWHYRSRSEALIAFSNTHYYEGSLMSFPSPLTVSGPQQDGPGGHGICLRRVEGHYVGTQERAKHPGLRAGTNPVEARQVVEEVVRRFEASPQAVPSLGIITMNTRQRELIESMLRREGGDRVLRALDARDAGDGLFVRNLENVQGEERDTILLSVVFSANEHGDVPLNIGALNRAGGERRLNVAITRARRQVVVFTSFDPEQLHAERSAHQGVKDLRAYIEHARRGSAPRTRRVHRGEVDLHRNAIAERLREAGLTVRVGVGHSSFAIDLLVALEDQPESTGAAVLLDGPGWNRRQTVTDRDLLPVDVLRSMGWQRVERIWMPEWVQQEQTVVDRIIRAVGGRPTPAVPAGAVASAGVTATGSDRRPAPGTPPAVGESDRSGRGAASSTQPGTEPPGRGRTSDGTAIMSTGPVDYRPWLPGGVLPTEVLNRASTDEDARRQVIEVARAVCDVESPIARRRLIVKVCRAFGVSRTTANRERAVREVLGEAFAYVDRYDFVWRSIDSRSIAPPYRRNALDHVDSIAEIHPEELTALMAEVRAGSPEWYSTEELCGRALRRLSTRRRKLSARGVLDALTAALDRAEREVD
ncbi:DUF3320 domain-containing protein [Actinomyces howellii]|uniref:Putative DNA helicase n=1 Tax=Actinomyces howellii TaxID=52771 RepID=A0A3S5EH25_9ACTO|nr:DUF3320 domain-containing protein [Actinomyces howellii]VEG28382.1 putative DNA helicase [Actinomyces howellii]